MRGATVPSSPTTHSASQQASSSANDNENKVGSNKTNNSNSEKDFSFSPTTTREYIISYRCDYYYGMVWSRVAARSFNAQIGKMWRKHRPPQYKVLARFNYWHWLTAGCECIVVVAVDVVAGAAAVRWRCWFSFSPSLATSCQLCESSLCTYDKR